MIEAEGKFKIANELETNSNIGIIDETIEEAEDTVMIGLTVTTEEADETETLVAAEMIIEEEADEMTEITEEEEQTAETTEIT